MHELRQSYLRFRIPQNGHNQSGLIGKSRSRRVYTQTVKETFRARWDRDSPDSADMVLQNFLTLDSGNKVNDSELVYRYYSETLKNGYAKSLEIKTQQDIWIFVTPTEIIIHWDENGEFYLCVSCECVWEQEHGLLLVFKNGQILTRASGHDGHFED